jgi:hypothetical protein
MERAASAGRADVASGLRSILSHGDEEQPSGTGGIFFFDEIS